MNLSHSTFRRLAPGQEVSTSDEILSYPASHYPNKIGLICGTRQWTFAQLDKLANQFAHAVLTRLADRPGPVGIMSRNSAEYAIAHFGTARSGRLSVNYPTRCTREEFRHAAAMTNPSVMVVDAGSRDLIKEAHQQLAEPPLILLADEADQNADSAFWSFIKDQPESPPAITVNPDESGFVIFTGGTTGKPKAVLSSQRARAVSGMAAVEDFRIQPDDVAGYSVPFTHTAGLFSWFQPAVLAGCTGVIVPKWDPASFMQLTEAHGINVIFAVPTQLAKLLDHPDFDPEPLRSLKMIAFGGAPLPRRLIERAEQAMPWLDCARAYGSTETGHLAAQRRADRPQIYDGLNQPGGRLEIEIFKAPGIVAEVGDTGEVATRGPHLMTRYIDNEEATAEFFKTNETDGQWGWMGDLAVKHEGYFTIVGRSKHMILSGGLNIFPTELEEILISHPAVADCVVFGIDDPTWGELPAAAVVSSGDGADAEALMDHVADRVSRHKRVRKIFFVDHIPRTGAGKAQVEIIKNQCLGSTSNDQRAFV